MPILVHVSASLSLGGAETVLFSLAQGLQPYYDQRVISLSDGPFVEKIRALGIPVTVISGNPVMKFIRLWRALDQAKPTVIHALLWSANAFARIYAHKRRIPLVCAIHSPFNTNTGNSFLRAWFDRFSADWATYTVFVSPGVLQQALIAPYVPIDKRVIIQNGIAIDELCMVAEKNRITRAELGLHEQDFVIGTVGRLVRVKNQQLLIKLVDFLHHKYPNIRLIIVGDGLLKNELARLAQNLGVADVVYITSGIGAAYYQLFDCFVQPSYTEGLSMALLEAMSFKVPVLVSSSTGRDDIITPEVTGDLFDPTDLSALATQVERLILDESAANQLTERAYQLVSVRFTVQTMVDEYKQVITRTLRVC